MGARVLACALACLPSVSLVQRTRKVTIFFSGSPRCHSWQACRLLNSLRTGASIHSCRCVCYDLQYQFYATCQKQLSAPKISPRMHYGCCVYGGSEKVVANERARGEGERKKESCAQSATLKLLLYYVLITSLINRNSLMYRHLTCCIVL